MTIRLKPTLVHVTPGLLEQCLRIDATFVKPAGISLTSLSRNHGRVKKNLPDFKAMLADPEIREICEQADALLNSLNIGSSRVIAHKHDVLAGKVPYGQLHHPNGREPS